jgi:hypothetical protein
MCGVRSQPAHAEPPRTPESAKFRTRLIRRILEEDRFDKAAALTVPSASASAAAAALARELERERARDRLVTEGWSRVEASCATCGGPPPPRLRDGAAQARAAAARLARLDAWAATPEGRALTALCELAAALAEAQGLYAEARACADRAFTAEAHAVATRAHALDAPLKRAREAALELWLATQAA